MNEIYLVVVIFVLPFIAALYIWRDEAPKQSVYYICFSVSTLSVIILVLGTNILAALMPIGLFLASTSFFAGIYSSGIVRRIRQSGNETTDQDDPS